MLSSGHKKVMVSAKAADILRPGTAITPSAARSGADAYLAAVLTDSPVFFFRMDESTGNLVDGSGNGYSGVLAGTGSPTYQASTGRTGLPIGVQLAAASSQRFEVADAAALDQTGAFSFEIWFRFASNPGAEQILETKGHDAGSSYDFTLQTNGALKCNNNGVGGAIAAGAVLSTGVLHHAVLTRSGSSGILYIDGASYSTTGAAFAPTDTGQPFTIGCYSISGTRGGFFNGILAAAALYPSALSAARVTAHYNAGI